VPASRPRVSRFGTYYSKNYETFRNLCFTFLQKLKNQYKPTSDKYKVELEFVMYKPNKPAADYPSNCDIDNLIKGPLDAITKVGMIWVDDSQITDIKASKRYQNKDEDYGIWISVDKI